MPRKGRGQKLRCTQYHYPKAAYATAFWIHIEERWLQAVCKACDAHHKALYRRMPGLMQPATREGIMTEEGKKSYEEWRAGREGIPRADDVRATGGAGFSKPESTNSPTSTKKLNAFERELGTSRARRRARRSGIFGAARPRPVRSLRRE